MEEKKKKKKKEIKELGIDLIQGKSRSNSKEIAWNLFIKNHNQVSMFVQTNPEEYKKNINENEKQKIERKKEKGNKIQTSPKRLNTNSINSCFKMWIGCKDFLDEIRSFSTKFKCMKKTYQFNKSLF